MRVAAALLTLLLTPGLVAAQATPPPAGTPAAQPPPAQPPRPRPRAAASTATATLTISVIDPTGAPVADVKVSATGTMERDGVTTGAGQVRFLGIRPGTYRVRFEREGFNTFEKEITWRAGTPLAPLEATLTPAPAPPPPPPPPPSKPAEPEYVPDLPAGKAANLSVPDFIERNHITNKEPHKENLIGCSGGAQTWLWQVREPWQNRKHDSAELMLYVVGGEGSLNLGGNDVQVAAGTFFMIPRGTSYSLAKRGRAPAMYLLATLSGPPCAK